MRLDYQDLQWMLYDLATYRRESIHRFLENFIESVYIYIGIDLIGEYAELTDVPFQRETLIDYIGRPGVLAKENHEWALTSRGLSFQIFEPLKEKMIQQGATAAIEIDPSKHSEKYKGAVVFSVQGPYPTEWEWVEKVLDL